VNLALSLLAASERTPDAEAIVEGSVRLTYRDLRERAARLAGGLEGLGVTRGDRVAGVLDNRRETAELFWACWWLGASFVPISYRIAQAEIDYCVDDSRAKVIAIAGDEGVRVGDAKFEDLLGSDEHQGALDLDEREEGIVLYTSGTTGRPKGVPRSHRADRAGGLSQVFQHGLRHGDRTLGVMPLYHTMGLHSLVAVSLVGGCFVCQGRWEVEEALGLIQGERLSSLYLAPTLFHDLVHHPRRHEFDLSSVESLSYAGAAMTSALVRRCEEAFRPRIFVNHYGSTEIYTYSVHRDQRAKPGCAGRPSVNARIRLVDPGEGAGPDDLVAPGEDGQIICDLTSDEAFAGYWNRPDANEKALRGGWFFTGDLGRLDAEGDLWIVGRVDDMIISGGENVHPLEVEDVLARHPAVSEVAVVGSPDDRLGEHVTAYIVQASLVTAEELDAHCLAAEDLARFKRPREYRFVDELPRSPSGKLLRRMLREESVSA
jgi:2-furoate---CoA ligase